MFAALLSACVEEEPKDETPVDASGEDPSGENPSDEGDPPVVEPEDDDPIDESVSSGVPLVVATDDLNEKFSPFFSESGYDRDVYSFTQIGLMTTDRQGGIIYNAIKGETVPYNGKDYTYKGTADLSVNYDETANITTYKATLKEGIKFSDGVEVTADDIIFNYYVYLDSNYTGYTTLNTYDIVGLNSYLTQTPDDIYDKYLAIVSGIAAAGPDHEWSEEDAWTQEQQDGYWVNVKECWIKIGQDLVEDIYATYGARYVPILGFDPDSMEDDGMKIAFAMALWGFADYEPDEFDEDEYDEDDNLIREGTGELVEEGEGLTGEITGKNWTLKDGDVPTFEDFYEETNIAYENDINEFLEVEFDGMNVAGPAAKAVSDLANDFITEYGSKDDSYDGSGIKSIAGIKKLDKYSVEVTVKGYSAPAVYTILGIEIAPLHYYGDLAQYDYEAGKYGFPRGDLSIVRSKTTKPMGAGPYIFEKYENKTVYYTANENYYKGAPKIKELQLKVTNSSEVAAAVKAGTIDIGDQNGSKLAFEEIKGHNENKELSGDAIHTVLVDNLGYGFIGINASNVNVNGEPGSDASKNLRRAFATILSVYRDVAVNSYYAEAATVINYPISNTSWAAPQPTDENYNIAFSTDIAGNPLYTSSMSSQEKEDAALKAALDYFAAAGYTVENGKITAGPEGTRGTQDRSYMEFEMYVAAEGKGEHPSFAILTDASKALESIGIKLNVTDFSQGTDMWNKNNANQQDLWCAAWQATIDPDMHQVYHSSNVIGANGTDSNYYNISSAILDDLIMKARESDNQSYRKSVYKQALDEIIDWAVEVPTYQRQNCTVFSAERVDISTLTPDITTFWSWANDIQLLIMK
jgi:peptide/nickel transport system substrate-binding protein